jgi:hypothetical protein
MDMFGKTSAPKEAPKKLDLTGKKVIPFVKLAKAEKPKGLVMGTPETWDSMKPYAKNATVSLEGKKYTSLKNNNLSTPSSSAADWR